MAHGLVLRMQDMMGYRRSDKSPNEQGAPYVMSNANPSSGDVNIPKLWANAVESPKNSNIEFLTLLRRTLLFMLSPKWTNYADKGDLLCAFKYHHSAFPNITDNVADIYKAVLEIFKKDPWKNSYFLWDDLFDGTLTIYDKRVQDYFESEPEEVVLARVHAIVSRRRANDALCLAKASFLYHSRIAKSFRSSGKRNSSSSFSTKGHASIDWFLFILQKLKSLDFIVNEAKQLKCHEGVEIVCRLWRDPKNKPICYTLLQIFLLHDLVQPSKYCCTKKLLKLFCLMHEELHSSPKEIAESCHKLFSNHAPSSAHFYLFVDVLWRQFGIKCLDLYVDLYVRGLTADINHLENQRHLGSFSDAKSLETHIAAIFIKLSTLFKNFNLEITRECMFSAFSLRPTKEKLSFLQRLSQSLSKSNKDIHKSLLDFDFSTDCNCGLRCIGHCRDTLNKSSFIHPLLSSSIGNISYFLKRDFISVLENVRCFTLQYNVFNWQFKIGNLDKYLSSFSHEKATWKKSESDTESGEEVCVSGVEDTTAGLETANELRCQFDRPAVKRKSGSDCVKEIIPLNAGENIATVSCDSTSKRIKTENLNVEVSVTVSSNSPQINGFNDCFEKVIKMSLQNNPAKHWSDNMNLLNVNKEPSISDFNSTRIGRKPETSFQSCLSERNTYNKQICIERKVNLLHYSDKTRHQISGTPAYDHAQQRVAVSPGNNPFKEIVPSKSQLVQNTSPFTATQPVSETFPNSRSSPKQEKRSNQDVTNLHFAKSERERAVHSHHLHSSPFVSSQPPPKSFLKHQLLVHSFGDEKAQSMTSMTTQKTKESIPCDTRKSVIVNVAGKSIQIPNQLSVKSSAIHQNRNNLQKDNSTLPLLHVNVPNKYLSKSDIPVNANLIIPYKHDNPASSVSQTSTQDSNVEMVAVPGIIAPSSMIKNEPWKTTVQNHANTFFPTKISDGTPSGLPKEVFPKSYTMQLFQPKTGDDLTLKKNESEPGISIFKPMKNFEELTQNNVQHAIRIKEKVHSSAQQLNDFPDPKLKWTVRQVQESSRSQTTLDPISDSHSVPATTSSQPWYASPFPKTSSNSPVSNKVHKMHSPKTSCSSPVSFSAQSMNIPKTSCNSPASFSVQNMKTSTTNSNSPVSLSIQNAKTLESFGDKEVSTFSDESGHNFSDGNIIHSKSGSSFLKSRLTSMHNTQSYSPMNAYSHANSFSIQDKVYRESLKSSQNQKYPVPESSVQSFIPATNVRTNSITSSQIHSNSKAYSESLKSSQNQKYPVPERSVQSFNSAANVTTSSITSSQIQSNSKAYSESLKSSQNQNYHIPEISVQSFNSCNANVTTNSITSSQIQSNSRSAYNSVYTANDGRVVHGARNIATSSNVQNTKSNVYSQQCCSTFEVNPCDTCSTKTSKQLLTKTQVNSFRLSPVENQHNQVADSILSDGNCFEVSKNMHLQTETREPKKMCSICAFSFPASEIKTHIKDAHQEELFNSSNYNIQNQILNKESPFSVSNSQAVHITSYDLQKENHLVLENTIRSACNTGLDIESSQNTDQFISSLLDFIDPNFDKSIEGSYENTGNSHPINSNELPCENSKSESLSEMLKEVDFSRNISSDLSAICDENELSYDLTEDKQSSVENSSLENKDIKSWYNNLSLDLLSNDDKPLKEMATFEISEFKPHISKTSSLEQTISIGKNKIHLENKQTFGKIKNAYDMFRTGEPLEQSTLLQNIQELDAIGNFQNTSRDLLNDSFVICPICKRKLDVDMQHHINICHPGISGDIMLSELNSTNNSETDTRCVPEAVFFPSSSHKQLNTSEIFDFDSYSSENAAKEVYRPLQKGKPKVYSSNSSCNSENTTNIETKFNAQDIVSEIPINKKKGLRVTCTLCNKVYSKNYIKTHFKKDHMNDQLVDCFKMSENSSNQSLSGQTAISSSTPEQNLSIPCISDTLLQEDIDTRTCLSTSDALNTCSKFEASGIKKIFSHDSSNRIVQLEQKYLFDSVTGGVKESSVGNLNFVLPEQLPKTALKGKKTFNSKQRNALIKTPNTTKKYPCNWSQNGNYCNQSFKSKLALKKHLKDEHTSTSLHKCNWCQNGNYCNQTFRTEALLFRHLKTEHIKKNSKECDIQQNTALNKTPTVDRNPKMEEKHLFCDSTNNKDKVLMHDHLQKTQRPEPASDLPNMNLNHEFRKVNDSVNSVMQFNSDKSISFSQNEHALTSKQVCSEDLDNHLFFEIPEKNDTGQFPPKLVSHLFNNSSEAVSDIVSTERISLKQIDVSNSVNESSEKSFNQDELSDLLNSLKDSTPEKISNHIPQKFYEKYNALSFVSDTKESFEDGNLVQNSILNEIPSAESFDFVTKDIGSDTSMLSLTSNSDSSSKPHNLFSNLLQDFEEANELSTKNESLITEGSNEYEKSKTGSVRDVNENEKLNEVFDALKSSENSTSQNAHYPISIQDSQLIKNSCNSEESYSTELIQLVNKSNLTPIAQEVDKSPLIVSSNTNQFDATVANFRINSSENCDDQIMKLKADLDFQTQLTEVFKDHESIKSVNTNDEEHYVESNKSVSLFTKSSVLNLFPGLSESDKKDMPDLVPEFDFQPLPVTENFKTDEDNQGSKKKLKEPAYYSFPNEIPIDSDISCPTVVVSLTGATVNNDQETFCDSSISSNSSCTYPKVLTNQDSKNYENLSFLTEEYSAFSSVDSLPNLSSNNEVDLLDSAMESKSNSVTAEHFNDSPHDGEKNSDIESEAVKSLPVKDLKKKIMSINKDYIESCDKLVDSEKTVGNQFTEAKLFKNSLALISDKDPFIENIEDKSDISIFQQEIKETVNNMLSILSLCEKSAFSNLKSCKKDKYSESRKSSAVLGEKAYSCSSVLNSGCGDSNLKTLPLCIKKKSKVSYEISVNQNMKTGKCSLACVLCYEVFQSDEGLSDHLKLIHDVPHLKKQISKSRKKLSVENVDKLSPPPLYLNSVDDYDSASAESSPNKYNEENCKNVTSEESVSAESEPSLLESNSNIDPELSESIKSLSTASEISSKFTKAPNIIRIKYQTERQNTKDNIVCSRKRKNKKDISSKKLSPDNIVTDSLDKDKEKNKPKCVITVKMKNGTYVVNESTSHSSDSPNHADSNPIVPVECLMKSKQGNICEKVTMNECHSSDSPNHADSNPLVQVECPVKSKHGKFCEKVTMNECHSSSDSPNHANSNPIVPVECPMKSKQGNFCEKLTMNECHSSGNPNHADSNPIVPVDCPVKCKQDKVCEKLKKHFQKRTLKPKNIKQFLIENKQPHVLLTRLDCSLLNSFNVSASKPDFTYTNFICKKAKVKLKRLDISNDDLKAIFSQRDPPEGGQKTLGTSPEFPGHINKEICSKYPYVKRCSVRLDKIL